MQSIFFEILTSTHRIHFQHENALKGYKLQISVENFMLRNLLEFCLTLKHTMSCPSQDNLIK